MENGPILRLSLSRHVITQSHLTAGKYPVGSATSPAVDVMFTIMLPAAEARVSHMQAKYRLLRSKLAA